MSNQLRHSQYWVIGIVLQRQFSSHSGLALSWHGESSEHAAPSQVQFRCSSQCPVEHVGGNSSPMICAWALSEEESIAAKKRAAEATAIMNLTNPLALIFINPKAKVVPTKKSRCEHAGPSHCRSFRASFAGNEETVCSRPIPIRK